MSISLEIEKLRKMLPDDIYLWVNAYKREQDYYSEKEIQWLESIDKNFRTNTNYHPSLGKACHAGMRSFSVDGTGDAFRCHFIKKKIGNIYTADFRSDLNPKTTMCTNKVCGCHIGYVNLDYLNLKAVYGNGILNRIPNKFLYSSD